MRRAASRGWGGASPVAVMSAGVPQVWPLLAQRGSATCQSSLLAMGVAPEKRVTTGLGSAPGTVNGGRPKVGPRARTRTVFAVGPPMTKPPISTLAPVWTWLRVERFVRRASTVVVTAMNSGLLNPVAAPERVRSGAVFPLAVRV